MKLTLKDASNYVRTLRASKYFLSIFQSVKRIFSFTEERSNRLTRYVAITRAYKDGQPVTAIVEKYGCSTGTVLRYARLAEIPKRPKHFPAETREAVIRDYKAGKMSVAQIAQLHSVSPAYVSKTAREENISRYAPRPKTKHKR